MKPAEQVEKQAAQHTPGPWRANGSAIEGGFQFANLIAHIYDERDSAIGLGETIANARLIAQAPRMAEVLRLIAKDYCPACGCDKHNTTGCYHCGLLQDAEAVLRDAGVTT